MADNLTTFMCLLSRNLEPCGPVQTCNGIALLLPIKVWRMRSIEKGNKLTLTRKELKGNNRVVFGSRLIKMHSFNES
jgi:hypothetical protein